MVKRGEEPEQTRSYGLWLELMAQFHVQVPHPLDDVLPGFLPPGE